MKSYGKSQSILAWGVIFFLGVIFLIIISASIILLLFRSKGDLKYGKKCFVVITEVDRYDPANVRLEGIVAIEDGQLTSQLPGAVFVVGVKEGAEVGGRQYEYGRIILLDSYSKYILAPPGTTLVVPEAMKILGKKFKAGQKIKVPKDSRFP